MGIDLLSVALAGCMGYGLARASLCMLAMALDLVHRRNPLGLALQSLTIGCMGVLLIGLAALLPQFARTAVGGQEPLQVLAGTAILVLGFVTNGGCYLGSISYLGQGKANFLLTLVGVYLANRYSLPDLTHHHATEALVPSTGQGQSIALLAYGVLVLVGVAFVLRADAPLVRTRARAVLWAAASGALFYTLNPGWSYSIVIASWAHGTGAPFWPKQAAAWALFGGAVLSCIRAGLWKPQGFTRAGAARCLVGGYLMETGAQCVPGGSDAWMVWIIPAGGLHGMVAYATAAPLLVGLIALAQRAQASRAR